MRGNVGRGEGERVDRLRVADDLRLFGVTGDWSNTALDPQGVVGLWPRG